MLGPQWLGRKGGFGHAVLLGCAGLVLPGNENDDDAVTLDEDEDGGVGRHLDGVIVAVTASSAR